MSCDNENITLPPTTSGDTWDGLTIALTSVDADDTRFAAVLSSARFQLQDSDGNAVLTLTSAGSDITLNETASNAWSITVEKRELTQGEGTYSWGLETIDADGIKKTYFAGTLTVKPDPCI